MYSLITKVRGRLYKKIAYKENISQMNSKAVIIQAIVLFPWLENINEMPS